MVESRHNACTFWWLGGEIYWILIWKLKTWNLQRKCKWTKYYMAKIKCWGFGGIWDREEPSSIVW
jgi:hypothetical protein